MNKQTRYIQFILHQQENHRNDQHARLNSHTLATDRSLKIKICTQTSKSVTNDPETVKSISFTLTYALTHLHIDIKVLDRKSLCALVQLVPHYLHVGTRMFENLGWFLFFFFLISLHPKKQFFTLFISCALKISIARRLRNL